MVPGHIKDLLRSLPSKLVYFTQSLQLLTLLNNPCPPAAIFFSVVNICIELSYAVKVKRHNVCKRHVAIATDFKQTERTIFLCVISMGKI